MGNPTARTYTCVECRVTRPIPPGRGQARKRCPSCKPSAAGKIRSLKAGEKVPDSEPRRYVSKAGYVVLRWNVARGQQVEIREHRVVDGYVTTAEHVHHINLDRSDNRPENLAHITEAEHVRIHGDMRSADDQRICALYARGMSTLEVAAAIGCNHGTVSRVLARNGVQARTNRDYFPFPEADAFHAAMRDADSSVALARRLGISVATARAGMKHYGYEPFPPGRRRQRPTITHRGA